jgi:hypothetical protein
MKVSGEPEIKRRGEKEGADEWKQQAKDSNGRKTRKIK